MINKNEFRCFFLFLFILRCNSSYDNGYEKAWEGEDVPYGFWIAQEEKDGYEDGQRDSNMYAEGYHDAYKSKKPKYLDDDFYMDGYKDAKRYRLCIVFNITLICYEDNNDCVEDILYDIKS
jgi:hypothetical protein